MTEELAPAYRALFEKAGPVLRYRILRDVAHQDETYIDTLVLRQEIAKLPQVREMLSRQQSDGSWGDMDSTEEAVLKLCEYGLNDCDAVRKCGEDYLLQRLSNRVLHLLVRAGFSAQPEVHQAMLHVLNDWKDFLERTDTDGGNDSDVLPTWDVFDAMCYHMWSEEESETVADVVTRLFAWAQDNDKMEMLSKGEDVEQRLFIIHRKEEYLAQPERMLYELELSARLGITGRTAVTRWMLEELEAHQDADGFFRFHSPATSSLPWYFPLDEPDASGDYTTDWTFRGMLIFGALEFDV
jgi:hypothetical protein